MVVSFFFSLLIFLITSKICDLLLSEKIKQIDLIEELGNDYKMTIEKLGIKSETIFTLKNYCEILKNASKTYVLYTVGKRNKNAIK